MSYYKRMSRSNHYYQVVDSKGNLLAIVERGRRYYYEYNEDGSFIGLASSFNDKLYSGETL